MKSFTRAVLALLLVSVILLLSDLQNRKKVSIILKPDVQAQSRDGKMSKLALVQYVDSPNSEDCERGLRKALEDGNLKENTDFTLKVYNAQGDMSTLNSIAETVGNEKWDLVFSGSTPTIQLLSKKLVNQNIVFTNVGDPVGAGLGKSKQDHLPNLTGISTMSDFEGLIDLVLELQPGIKHVGTVFTPAEINSVIYKDHLSEAAKKRGLELIAAPASNATEITDAANTLVAQGIDVFCQISDNLTGSSGSSIQKVSHDRKIPYYGFVTSQIDRAVAVCARDYFQAGYDAGKMGIEVLAGKNPANMPFQNVGKTDYLLNEDAARYFGISVPEKIFTLIPQLVIKNIEYK